MQVSSFPLACFLSTVSLSFAHLWHHRRDRTSRNRVCAPKATRRFANALVELKICPDGDSATGIELLLGNDLVLEQAVKEVSDTLYVHVTVLPPAQAQAQAQAQGQPDSSNSKTNALEYISSVYQRLWDEMIVHDNLGLNCVVGGDVPRSGFQTLGTLYGAAGLEAVYTASSDKEAFEKSSNVTSAGTSAAVQFPKVKAFPTKEGGKIYYFDACYTHIPSFQKVALGGTFDRIHNGHKKLLALAAAVCTGAITIGITGDVMLAAKKNAGLISSFAARRSGVEQFMSSIKKHQELNLVELSDPFGPTITDASIEAIVVSSETIGGALKINSLRAEKGMQPLVLLVTRRSESATLSSTFLRDRL